MSDNNTKRWQYGYDVKEEYKEIYHKVTEEDMAARDIKDWKMKLWCAMSPWEKLCCYKISGKNGADCDASAYSMEVYRQAFGTGDWTCKVCGDTMNSYATTVHEYLRKIVLPAHREEMLDRGIVFKGKNGALYVEKQFCGGRYDNAHWERAVLANYSFFEKLLPPSAERFFQLYHAIGNFIPVSPGFNARGDYYNPARDYWDLSLISIYHYFAGIKYPLSWLMGGSRENIAASQAWLALFGSWDAFVEKNFLQDFVDETGVPNELWDGHFSTAGTLPRDSEDFEQFFTRASAWIEARGRKIEAAAPQLFS